MLFFLLLPLWYVAVFIFWALILGTVLTLWLSLYVIIFVLTGLAMFVRWLFRTEWPRNPKRPKRPSPLRRPIPQSRYSNRR